MQMASRVELKRVEWRRERNGEEKGYGEERNVRDERTEEKRMEGRIENNVGEENGGEERMWERRE